MDLAGLSREDHVQSYLLLFLHFALFDCDCWIMCRDALFLLYSLAVATSLAAELAGHCRLDIEEEHKAPKGLQLVLLSILF